MKRHSTFLTTLLLCCAPAIALANPVGALALGLGGYMWTGNLIIGIFEGLLLAWFCGLRKLRGIAVMVLANFCSAIAGIWILERIRPVIALDLHNAWFWILAAVAVAYLMALVLEYPFFWVALRGTPNRVRRSIFVTLKVQTISYVLLFGWYGATSNLTILTDLTLVEPSSMLLSEPVAVYYIAEADGDVHRLGLAQGEPSFVYDLNSSNQLDHLWVRPSAADSNRWDLMTQKWAEDRSYLGNYVVLDGFATTAAPTGWQEVNGMTEAPPPWSSCVGSAARLGEARESSWNFGLSNWAREGMRASRTDTGVEFSIGFEMHLGDWLICNATHLPGDYVLFQLGRDQICLFDPILKRIAIIARGRGPVAVLEE